MDLLLGGVITTCIVKLESVKNIYKENERDEITLG